ncbi:MAG: flagellar biosynthetic protein FliQ [Pseudomonadota bacterium]
MNIATLESTLFSVLYYSAMFVAPPLIAATVIAFIVGLFQAVTQIQEQTLPQTIKIFVISFVLLVFGSFLVSPLYALTDQLFENFYLYGR